MDALFRVVRFAPLAAIVVLTAAPAVAQPGGRGFGPPGRGPGGGGIGMLLRSDEVRTELELLDDQVEQLQEIEREMRDKVREAFGGRRGGRGQGRPDFQAMREQMEELRTEVEERLSTVLTTQQMERLKQIETQQQLNRGGARALLGGQLAEQLGLTEEQQNQMREKARELQATMQEKIQAARDEAREELLSVLTSEQRAKLDELTGTPFTMTEDPRRGRGRGGRRPGPPGPAPGDDPEL